MIRTLCLCASVAILLSGCSQPITQRSLQERLIAAKPGSVIQIPAGKHAIDRSLSLTVANVTLRGAGMDKTVLSFAGQKSGAEGLLVTAGGFTIEDLAIEDTKGDALKINGADGVTIRRVRTEWTRGPHEKNGAYGIYPVQCKNVLIEDSVAIAASDAGIYVGQSSNIIVRRNRAERNVAGIEIENSQFSDVYENLATANTGGILVFNLPELPVKDGRYTRVFNNRIIANNTPNFAPKGNIVASVPAGTGLTVMATDQIEVFGNTIKDNQTSNVGVHSYLITGRPFKDDKFDPYPEAIYVHDNDISGGGAKPDGPRGAMIAKAAGGPPLPDMLYDGILNPAKITAARKLPEDQRVCFQNNGAATFLMYDAGRDFKKPSRDLKAYACTLPALKAVTLPQIAAATGSGGQ